MVFINYRKAVDIVKKSKGCFGTRLEAIKLSLDVIINILEKY